MVTSFSVISQMTYERDYNIVYCHFQIVSENLRLTKGVSLFQPQRTDRAYPCFNRDTLPLGATHNGH